MTMKSWSFKLGTKNFVYIDVADELFYNMKISGEKMTHYVAFQKITSTAEPGSVIWQLYVFLLSVRIGSAVTP